jgi:hypothetical protein
MCVVLLLSSSLMQESQAAMTTTKDFSGGLEGHLEDVQQLD